MKFLCIVCDAAMSLDRTEGPENGSITAVFECPECFHQIAMLTNPMETQAVASLGVSIGPGAGARAAEGGCPFSGMVAEMEHKGPREGMAWSAEALARLEAIPAFIRPMAKQGIEQFAAESGHREVTEAVMDSARDRLNRGEDFGDLGEGPGEGSGEGPGEGSGEGLGDAAPG